MRDYESLRTLRVHVRGRKYETNKEGRKTQDLSSELVQLSDDPHAGGVIRAFAAVKEAIGSICCLLSSPWALARRVRPGKAAHAGDSSLKLCLVT